jgi:DNA-binding response OmpR family regulator
MGTQRDFSFLQMLARRSFTPTRLRVLIVDPNLTSAQALTSALGREHTVAVVGTAEAALRSIDAHLPTILVTELDLPDISGLELLAALRTRPTTRHVLLLALTRRTSVQDKVMAFQAGADDYLVKPVDPYVFAEHIQRLSRFRQILGAGGL